MLPVQLQVLGGFVIDTDAEQRALEAAAMQPVLVCSFGSAQVFKLIKDTTFVVFCAVHVCARVPV